MTIEKLDPVFADTGDKDTDTVFDSWAEGGYVDERVRYKGINKELYRSDAKLNESIERLPKALPDDIGELPYIQEVFTPENDFSNARADLNVFSNSFDSCTDFCFAIIGGERKLLIVDKTVATSDPVIIFDIATGAFSGSGDLSADLSTPTTSWKAISICCDETYCYVMFTDTGPSPDEQRIQSWGLADFSVNAGWPATGLALTAGSVSFNAYEARIRNANDDKLVCTQPWVAVSSGTSAGLNIVNKADGTSDGVGAGVVGSVSNGQVTDVCSDGTTVFFPVELAASVVLSGMTIASPGASGPSGAGVWWPFTVSVAPSYFGGIACSGNLVVATWKDGTRLFTLHDTAFGFIAYYNTADTQKCETLGPICFDGKSFWAIGERQPYGTNSITHLFRLIGPDRGGFVDGLGINSETVSDGELFVDAYTTTDFLSGLVPVAGNRILSDGRDVWYFDALDSSIARLPRSIIR